VLLHRNTVDQLGRVDCESRTDGRAMLPISCVLQRDISVEQERRMRTSSAPAAT
jgi:hypothetical protein